MRDLVERHRPARWALAGLACLCVLSLVRAASADDASALRDLFFPFAAPPAAAPAAPPAAEPERPRRRRAAAKLSRPLVVTRLGSARRPVRQLARAPGVRGPANRPARLTGRAPVRVGAMPPPERGILFLPPPDKPPLVSILEDQTLRRGDAVVMADGLRVFSGREKGPHRPRDFVRLSVVASLDWRLRRTLDPYDHNPPDPWRG